MLALGHGLAPWRCGRSACTGSRYPAITPCPDPPAPCAGAHSGGQGWPVFGPPRQRRAASLTAASTTAGSIASGASRRTHQTWGEKSAHEQLKKKLLMLTCRIFPVVCAGSRRRGRGGARYGRGGRGQHRRLSDRRDGAAQCHHPRVVQRPAHRRVRPDRRLLRTVHARREKSLGGRINIQSRRGVGRGRPKPELVGAVVPVELAVVLAVDTARAREDDAALGKCRRGSGAAVTVNVPVVVISPLESTFASTVLEEFCHSVKSPDCELVPMTTNGLSVACCEATCTLVPDVA